MRAVLGLLLFVAAAARAEPVTIPAADVALQANFYTAAGAAPVVALHGCGGPWPRRDRQWAALLTGAGHPVLFPDSFGSRGLPSQCKVSERSIRPGRERRADALAAANWLRERTGQGVFVLGWSNGGSAVLAAARAPSDETIRGFIAFYPGCAAYARRADWSPAAPVLILMGEADDWTPAEPCHRLADRFPGRITLVTYPGSYHDFDVPGLPVRERAGLAYTAGGAGVAHTGTNMEARADAIARVLAFTASH